MADRPRPGEPGGGPLLTKDRPPKRTAGFKPADAHHVSATDQALVTDLETLAQQATALARTALPVLAMMRSHLAGQPRAASYSPTEVDPADDRDPLANRWCPVHDRFIPECVAAGDLTCGAFGGLVPGGPSDRTGTAAIGTDPASIDRAAFGRAIGRALASFEEAWVIASGYPAVAMEPETPDRTPGDDLCRAHWKVNKFPELIKPRAGGAPPRYKHLCRWCGDTRKALGGNYFDSTDPQGDPPTFLVEARIAGRVTPFLIEKAERQMAGKIKRAKAKAAGNTASKRRKRK